MILIMNPLRTEAGLIDEAAVRKSFSLIEEREILTCCARQPSGISYILLQQKVSRLWKELPVVSVAKSHHQSH